MCIFGKEKLNCNDYPKKELWISRWNGETTMEKIILFGAGKMGKSLYEFLQQRGESEIGFPVRGIILTAWKIILILLNRLIA